MPCARRARRRRPIASRRETRSRVTSWSAAACRIERLRSCTLEETVSTALNEGDLVVVEAGQFIPGDGEIIEGVASVDESAITGESAPVIREAGGDRSGVTGGTRVLSDRIVVQITAGPASRSSTA